MADEVLTYRGFLDGHERIPGEITSLAIGTRKTEDGKEEEFLLSGGRDNKLIQWEIDEKRPTDDDR